MRENNNTAMETEKKEMIVRNLRWGESCGETWHRTQCSFWR